MNLLPGLPDARCCLQQVRTSHLGVLGHQISHRRFDGQCLSVGILTDPSAEGQGRRRGECSSPKQQQRRDSDSSLLLYKDFVGLPGEMFL